MTTLLLLMGLLSAYTIGYGIIGMFDAEAS